MKLGIMQPYFLPYVGYYQLIQAVDTFIVYDDIKYTKKGWINRNRFLQNGRDAIFSVPLKKASDFAKIREREIAADFRRDMLLNKLREAYRRATFFGQTFPLVEQIVRYEDRNLFRFLHRSIVRTCEHLGITTEIKISSDCAGTDGLNGQDRVLALCGAVGASTYVNAIGGVDLYSRDVFEGKGVELRFIKAKPFEYTQFGEAFVPWLSIVDVMMFNPLDAIRACISTNYELI